eukprot:GHVU01079331.1.p1 GENE.GHVU01079331.1~~GHVU01079331.1.p1  ORF type:complete len:236 (-),score=12.13 GHVU01079331.1:12-719(-)
MESDSSDVDSPSSLKGSLDGVSPQLSQVRATHLIGIKQTRFLWLLPPQRKRRGHSGTASARKVSARERFRTTYITPTCSTSHPDAHSLTRPVLLSLMVSRVQKLLIAGGYGRAVSLDRHAVALPDIDELISRRQAMVSGGPSAPPATPTPSSSSSVLPPPGTESTGATTAADAAEEFDFVDAGELADIQGSRTQSRGSLPPELPRNVVSPTRVGELAATCGGGEDAANDSTRSVR